eukprot:s2382_g12.t1
MGAAQSRPDLILSDLCGSLRRDLTTCPDLMLEALDLLPLAFLLLHAVSHCRARQDGQTLDKINSTKYAAKGVAEYIQQWAPMKATDPSSQHTITQLQQQVAELKQRLGDTSDAAPLESSTPPPPSTSSPSAPRPSTPIHRALHGNAATPAPEFEPASLLVTPLTANTWLKDNAPTSMAVRPYNQWVKDLNLSPAQRATVERNLAKVEEWWQNQPESAVDTIQRTAPMMGLPMSILKGNFNDTNLVKVLTIALTMNCLLKRPAMSLNPQFGLATLWRKRRHKFTPTIVKGILGSARFQSRLAMWTLIHDLGSNTKSRFEATKFLRSHDGGLTVTYALCRLACNIQEPFRTMSIQAIDTTIAWWKGKLKPAPKAAAIRIPRTLSPDLERTISRFLRQWFHEVIAHHVPCHNPSFKVLFVKHQAVLDILCSHDRLVYGNHSHMLLPTLADLQTRQLESHSITPVVYFEAIDKTFMDPQVFVTGEDTPTQVVDTLVDVLKTQYGRSYPWAIGRGRQTPSGYILSKAKKEYKSGRPIISFVDAPFRPLARMLYQLIPVGCPHHIAVGDVYELLAILKSIPENQPLRLFNQDLAGFFTSIEPDRFIGAWYMLLDSLRPKMNVNNAEVFSVYPGKSNQPGDLINGRTFRRLNVTSKITIGDVPSLLTTALDMQTFALDVSNNAEAAPWVAHFLRPCA